MEIKGIKTTITMAGTKVPSPIFSLAYRIGEGAPEAVELVMEQIGRSDLFWAWASASIEVDGLVARERMAKEGDFMSSFKPASKELQAANSRKHEAWQPIQALIDVAQEYIDSLGYDGAPS